MAEEIKEVKASKHIPGGQRDQNKVVIPVGLGDVRMKID